MDISVIIPVRNRGEMLKRAIQSVLDQLHPNIELIVVDDGSTEDLGEVRDLVEQGGQRWLSQSHRGVSAARNTGIQKASSEWLAFLDSDDTWKPEKLTQQVAFHRDNPELRISQCKEEWYRNGKRLYQKAIHEMPSGEAFEQSLQLCCISPSAVMIHRSIFEQYGVFDESLPVCEDYELWLRITAGEEIGLIQEPLVVKYGGHEDQLSRSQPAIDRFRVYAICKLLAGNTDLSDAQRALGCSALLEKLFILSTGAKKHAPEHIPVYQSLITAAEGHDFIKCFRLAGQLIMDPAHDISSLTSTLTLTLTRGGE